MTLVLPSPEVQVLIRKEVNEDPETRDAAIQAIKDWLASQPHLPNTWEEIRILNTLRACSFSLEKCKKKLDAYFTIRAAAPEIFTNWDIRRPELRNLYDNWYAPPLPIMTPEGRRVTVVGGNKKNFPKYRLEDAAKIFFMLETIAFGEETFGNAGKVYVVDATIVTVAAFAKASFSLIRKCLFLAQDAGLVKIKEVHVVNVHPFVDVVFKIIRPLLKSKLLSRIHIHTNGNESLHKFVPRDVLPEEFGGAVGSLADINKHWLRKLEEHTSWFKEQEKRKADESKRPKKSKVRDTSRTEESFKNLSID